MKDKTKQKNTSPNRPSFEEWPYNRKLHPLYNRWRNMKRRCYDRKHMSFYHYNEKGITVCKEWYEDFWKFVQDMYPTYTKDYELDRINNDEEYSKENCQWLSKQQHRNKTANEGVSLQKFRPAEEYIEF